MKAARREDGTVRIGCGAGYSGDRIEPAVELVDRGNLDYIVFECLAERTIAIAQQARVQHPESGHDPRLVERIEAVLALCRARGTRLITNMGAANPIAGANAIRQVAERSGLGPLTIAVVTGDDVRSLVEEMRPCDAETGEPFVSAGIISANAYLGADAIVDALQGGADVVITGRVADPSLFLAPLIAEFGWANDDWTRLGRGTSIGHLLECAGQVTGGYFADPGVKDVPGLARLGFPLAEVAEDGTAIVTKVAGSGGAVTVATCTEQLLYEIHDPSAYVTPDVVADFSRVQCVQEGLDRVRIDGASGGPRPEMLKASVGQFEGWIGEGQISYAGPGAVPRARLAGEIVGERLRIIGVEPREIRFDLIGVNALHGRDVSAGPDPYEVRLRVAARTDSAREAQRVAQEVEALYTNGPAGGGGATMSVRQVLGMRSVLVPRARVPWQVTYQVVR